MNNLRILRKTKNLNQNELANIVGVQQSTISNWESERTEIDTTSLNFLANYFNVSIDYLLGRSDDNNHSPLPNLEIPDNLKDARIAFYGGIEDLTQEDLEDVNRYIEFVKSKKRK